MRNPEDLKEFALEVLDKYRKYLSPEDEEIYNSIVKNIKEKTVLSKEEAELLEKILNEQLKDDMIIALKQPTDHLISEVDVLSNYPDVWYQYCKNKN